MSIDIEILTASRDRQFDDWGVIVTFRHFADAIDPETGIITETNVDTPLVAIPLNRQFQPVDLKMRRELRETTQFQLKTEDLPVSNPQANTRILFSGEEYVVFRYELSSDALVQTLSCQRRSA